MSGANDRFEEQRIAALEAERSNYDVEVHAAYREIEKLRAENQRLRDRLAVVDTAWHGDE